MVMLLRYEGLAYDMLSEVLNPREYLVGKLVNRRDTKILYLDSSCMIFIPLSVAE